MRLGAWLSLAAAAGILFSSRAIRAVSQDDRPVESPPFVDATAESRLDFVHVNGARGELLLPEVIGSGGALFDYDNDGDLDVFAVQGASLRQGDAADAPRSRLYRNDRGPGTGPRFTDVTEGSRLRAVGYGIGAATGDYDNDGWIDLYVTYLGPNKLFRNNGDGTFADVTGRTRTGDPKWSTSAAFFDYDRDGWLDLYVTNYVNFSTDLKRACFSAASARDYCNPDVYEPASDTLYRNSGDGTFTDVSAGAGLLRSPARGLGVIAFDANEDGWTDLFVANDGDPNQLWINGGANGAFTDDALLTGVALNRMGRAQGSMGVDAGDVDGDGDQDLFVTNLDNEGHTFYRNVGNGFFEDRTVEAGVFALGFTGFGTRMLDYDNDSWLDLAVVNGAVRHLSSQTLAGDPHPLKQRSQLFRNDAGRRFADVADSSGAPFRALQVGRGLATGDLDNDGDTDLVVFNNGGSARVLVNAVGSRRHWLGVRVLDGRARRDAVHTQVSLTRGDGRAIVRRVQADGSYAAASDPRVLFGLDGDASAQTVRVRWTDGRFEDFRGLEADRYWELRRGMPPRALP